MDYLAEGKGTLKAIINWISVASCESQWEMIHMTMKNLKKVPCRGMLGSIHLYRRLIAQWDRNLQTLDIRFFSSGLCMSVDPEIVNRTKYCHDLIRPRCRSHSESG